MIKLFVAMAALAYIISPIDFAPGFIDDLIVVILSNWFIFKENKNE